MAFGKSRLEIGRMRENEKRDWGFIFVGIVKWRGVWVEGSNVPRDQMVTDNFSLSGV